MGDLIWRAEMLEALGHFNDYVNGDPHFLNGIKTANEITENLPAVDAVPVVRCKDCKHWWKANELCTHKRHVHGTVCVHECKATDYCSDGERREAR